MIYDKSFSDKVLVLFILYIKHDEGKKNVGCKPYRILLYFTVYG